MVKDITLQSKHYARTNHQTMFSSLLIRSGTRLAIALEAALVMAASSAAKGVPTISAAVTTIVAKI
jgi:hypothetical protein